MLRFVLRVWCALRRLVVLVRDRWRTPRGAARWREKRPGSGIAVAWLPPYAPELNPVEYAWTNTKCARLADFISDDVAHLQVRAREALKAATSAPRILRPCFDHAQLNLGEV